MPPRVLYIAGYSRCGSTLLDILLNSHPRITSTGELTYLHEEATAPHRTCTCGAPYQSCPRFGGWLATRPSDEARIVRRVERRGSLDALRRGQVEDCDASVYRDYGQSLFNDIASETGAEIVVDSSKSARDAAGRPLALRRLADLNLRVLHLTRDPHRTLQSYFETGSNWVKEGHRAPRPFETWRPILGWALANRIARQMQQDLGPDRYLHLRFEDLISDPNMSLGRVGAFIDVDLSDVARRVKAGEVFHAGHAVGGNRTRLAPLTVRTEPQAPVRLPRPQALGMSLVGRTLVKELGYA